MRRNCRDDPESKAIWERMANRWLTCARLAAAEHDALRHHREEKANRPPRRYALRRVFQGDDVA